MKKIKNNILWILCILNYLSYLIIYLAFSRNVSNTLFYCAMWAFLYAAFISGIVTIAGIGILVYRLIKNKTLRSNNIVLLILFVCCIPELIFLGIAWRIGIGL